MGEQERARPVEAHGVIGDQVTAALVDMAAVTERQDGRHEISAGRQTRWSVAPDCYTVASTDIPDGTVLFDGICVLCSWWFRFVAARDPQARFRFAPIQGARGRHFAILLGINPDDPQTNAVILDGRAHVRSDAAIQVLQRLPGWGWTRWWLVIPRRPRDWLYDRVARNRYRWFGRTETCMVPDHELRRHLLPDTSPLA